MTSESSRSVILDYDTLLVLSDMLHHWEIAGAVSEPRDQAERVALWNVTALLEPLVDEVFSGRYDEAVSAAKARLTGAG